MTLIMEMFLMKIINVVVKVELSEILVLDVWKL